MVEVWRSLDSGRKAVLAVGAVAIVADVLVRSYLGESSRGATLLSALLLALVAGTAMALAFRTSDVPSHPVLVRLGWRAMGWFATAWGVGTIMGALGVLSPDLKQFPLAPFFLFVSYLPALLAVGCLFWAGRLPGRARLDVDLGLTATAILVVAWSWFIRPTFEALPDRPLTQILTVGFPIGDTGFALGGAFLIFIGLARPGLRRATLMTATGFMLIAVGGFTQTLLGRSQMEWAVTFWPIGFWCLAWGAATWPDARVGFAAQTEAPKSALMQYFGILGPVMIGFAAFGAVVVREVLVKGSISPSLLAFGLVTAILIVARQLLTVTENLRLTAQIAGFNAELERTVERRTSQLQALHALATSMGHSLDLDEVLGNVQEHAAQALRGDAVILNLTPFSLSGLSRVGDTVRTRGLEGSEWVLDQISILEIPPQGVFGGLMDRSFKHGLKYVLAPILSKGRPLGWIAVLREEGPFDISDAEVLEGIGAELGTALENVRLYEVARQMADLDPVTGLLNHRSAQERLEYLFEHAQAVNEPLSLLMVDVNNFKHFNDTYGHLAGDQVLRAIAKGLREVAKPHDVLVRYGGDEFMVILPNVDAAEAQERLQAILEVVESEGYAEPGTDCVIPYKLSIGAATFPEVKSRHELIYHADLEMGRAKRASGGGMPRKTLRKPSSQRGDSFDLLDSMVNAVDNKDYYTRAHSEEVSEYALWIAQEMGFSEETLRTVRMAALLHDVGKIGIPDEILRKPGQLSDEEFEVMKQHPVVGAMMVAAIPGIQEILPGVRHHHERWDGQGYPDQLVGEAIPLLGRILAVPDAFSAMTTDRPYRKGMDWDEACRRIDKGSGTQFDPAIVRAFFSALEKRRPRQEREERRAA